MSIVEKAIKRLQGAAPSAQPRRVFGEVVEATAPHAAIKRLICIDQNALRAAGLLAPKQQERRIASQYRQIKRPLIAAAMGKGRDALPNGRLIMVASALSGEGKTFTAINLAFSMAMGPDVRVVLVDADVAKPQISRMFGMDGEEGLIDGVGDTAMDLERLILPTDVPNLFLMSAGKSNQQATELLASDRMIAALDRLLRNDPGRIIIFDSPPLLLTTEAPALAHVVGQVVVVVRAGSTEQHTLFDALAQLPEGSSASLILNQSTTKSAGSYYYDYGSQAET